MERVVIGDQETPADDPQLEAQQAEAEEPQEVQQQQEESEKPDWLPDKFTHPEELAKAYGQLEKKLSSRQAEEQGLVTPSDLEKYEEEYLKNNGTIGDESYKELAKKGISKELVDSFIEGREHLSQKQADSLFGLAGGEENYTRMTDWAGENIGEDEMESFNNAVGGRDVGLAKLAIQGLYSLYSSQAQTAPTPALVQGGKAAPVTGYGSTYEMTQDMKNPLYKNGDKAFHAMVEKRLEMSDIM
jgi:hypothetical protein